MQFQMFGHTTSGETSKLGVPLGPGETFKRKTDYSLIAFQHFPYHVGLFRYLIFVVTSGSQNLRSAHAVRHIAEANVRKLHLRRHMMLPRPGPLEWVDGFRFGAWCSVAVV